MTFHNLFIEHDRTDVEKEWLKQEIAEQATRYKGIVKAMQAIDPQRDIWYGEFFDRIQKRGFNTDGDQRRKIAPEDIPLKPDRPHKVVY